MRPRQNYQETRENGYHKFVVERWKINIGKWYQLGGLSSTCSNGHIQEPDRQASNCDKRNRMHNGSPPLITRIYDNG